MLYITLFATLAALLFVSEPARVCALASHAHVASADPYTKALMF